MASRLTEAAVRNAKPGATDRKLYDERGLYLLIAKGGSKRWRLKYYLDGRERLCSLGVYPDIGLKEAREACDAKRKDIAKGVDPIEKKREKAAEKQDERRAIFANVAERFYKKKQAKWSDTHRRDVRRMIDKEMVPALGALPVAAIKTADVRKLLDQITERGALTYAKDVKTYFRAILNFHNSEREHDKQLADPSVRVTIADAPEEKPHASLEPQQIGPFLCKLRYSDAGPLIRLATRFLLLTATRTNEMRYATWAEVDTKERLWRLAPQRMKARRAHVVPLSAQVLSLLAELRTISGEHPSGLLFPSAIHEDEPISSNAILACVRRMGYAKRVTGHGFRSMFSRFAHEARTDGGAVTYSSDAIERQLGHAHADKTKAAYLHSEFLADRVRLMAHWADYLDQQERDAAGVGVVVPLRSLV